MGDILKVSCDTCSYERSFRIGQGLLHKAPGRYLIETEIESKQLQQELLERMERGATLEASRAIYICGRCGQIGDRLDVVAHGAHPFRTRYRCPRCNAVMERMTHMSPDTSCARCEAGVLRHEVTGQWD